MCISGCHRLAQTSVQVPICLRDLTGRGFGIEVMSREFPLNLISFGKGYSIIGLKQQRAGRKELYGITYFYMHMKNLETRGVGNNFGLLGLFA